MSITRTFLDWSQPALPAAVDWLCATYGREVAGQPRRLDLHGVVVIVPGGRAGRKLSELLADRAMTDGWLYHPPDIRTVGSFPELLYQPQRPFAGNLVQQLAWLRALRETNDDRRRHIIARAPDPEDNGGWLALAQLLAVQHRELAADGLSFADVAEQGSCWSGFREATRWQVLGEIQDRYLRILDRLELWDRQTARLVAIRNRECTAAADLILLATTDLNRAPRQMLDQISDRVTALIHAPETWSDYFDAHGCLVPDRWSDVTIPLRETQIDVVAGPNEQADAVAALLASYNGRYRADQLAIGVPDQRLVPQISRRLAESRLATRWVAGKTVAESGPARLLQSIADLLQRDRFAEFAQLIRHPDVEDWLVRRGVTGDFLSQVDRYYQEHLPTRLGEGVMDAAASDSLNTLGACVTELLQPLTGEPQQLHRWADRLLHLLSQVFGALQLDPRHPAQRVTLSALQALQQSLSDLEQIPNDLAPVVTAAEAIALVLREVADQTIPPLPAQDAVEVLGWLELPLDTAPALVVTTFNEGFVPTSVNADIFLPNTLRQQLGLVDNRRRYARDAYALCSLAAGKQELHLIAARRSPQDDPLIPSRLAFAIGDEDPAARVQRFFESPESSSDELSPADADIDRIEVPLPLPLAEPITTLAVTSFRSYLACPYRFYLRHLLRLEPLDDETTELAAPQFGNLIHSVLERFGRDSVAQSTREEAISEFLQLALAGYVLQQFGRRCHPAVELQVAQARARLEAFARWQAAHAAEGWEIVHTEVDVRNGAALDLGQDRSVNLIGRIDRIDRRGDEWFILDYKTGDTVRTPEQTHRQRDEWVDLQLPLYRHLVKPLKMAGAIQLGYIVLPRETNKTELLAANWNAGQLADADRTACLVAGRILDQRFWPPRLPPPRIMSEYGVICQDEAMQPQWADDPGRETP